MVGGQEREITPFATLQHPREGGSFATYSYPCFESCLAKKALIILSSKSIFLRLNLSKYFLRPANLIKTTTLHIHGSICESVDQKERGGEEKEIGPLAMFGVYRFYFSIFPLFIRLAGTPEKKRQLMREENLL